MNSFNTNNTTLAFESSLFEGVDTCIKYVANEFLGKEWMTNSIEQRKKKIREVKNKLTQEYTYEFRKWYYEAFGSNVNMTILANTYYEKLRGKWSNYFQEEFDKI